MRTGLLNVEKETKSTEPSTFGYVIFQNGAPEKVISISLELQIPRVEERNGVSINENYSHPI